MSLEITSAWVAEAQYRVIKVLGGRWGEGTVPVLSLLCCRE